MKTKILVSLLALVGCLTLIVGCVVPNPSHVAGDNNPAFTADTNSVAGWVSKITAVNQATAPLNPYSSLTQLGIDAGGGIALLASTLLAWFKSRQAKTAKSVAQVMAQGVVKANAQSAVLDVASSTPHYAKVADHINDATP